MRFPMPDRAQRKTKACELRLRHAQFAANRFYVDLFRYFGANTNYFHAGFLTTSIGAYSSTLSTMPRATGLKLFVLMVCLPGGRAMFISPVSVCFQPTPRVASFPVQASPLSRSSHTLSAATPAHPAAATFTSACKPPAQLAQPARPWDNIPFVRLIADELEIALARLVPVTQTCKLQKRSPADSYVMITLASKH